MSGSSGTWQVKVHAFYLPNTSNYQVFHSQSELEGSSRDERFNLISVSQKVGARGQTAGQKRPPQRAVAFKVWCSGKGGAADGVSRMINMQMTAEVMGVDGITHQAKWKAKKENPRSPEIFRSKYKYYQIILTLIQHSLFVYN